MQRIVGTARTAMDVLPMLEPVESEVGFRFVETASHERWLLVVSVVVAVGLCICTSTAIATGGDGVGAGFIWIPLLLVGLGYFTFRGFRGFAAHRRFAPATLDLGLWPLRMGDEVPMRYRRQARSPQQVRRAEVKLICTEVATYQQGTDTRTVSERVHEELVHREAKPDARETVDFDFTLLVPRNGPPSFEVTRNQILWTLEVTLVLEGAPDVTSNFKMIVAPEVIG